MTVCMKYLSKPARQYWEESWQEPKTSITVIEEDDRPQDTGLLDADGNRLYRVKERRPIGFTAKWAKNT